MSNLELENSIEGEGILPTSINPNDIIAESSYAKIDGGKLQALRRFAKLTQEKLASLANLENTSIDASRQRIGRIERGELEASHLDQERLIKALSQKLGRPISKIAEELIPDSSQAEMLRSTIVALETYLNLITTKPKVVEMMQKVSSDSRIDELIKPPRLLLEEILASLDPSSEHARLLSQIDLDILEQSSAGKPEARLLYNPYFRLRELATTASSSGEYVDLFIDLNGFLHYGTKLGLLLPFLSQSEWRRYVHNIQNMRNSEGATNFPNTRKRWGNKPAIFFRNLLRALGYNEKYTDIIYFKTEGLQSQVEQEHDSWLNLNELLKAPSIRRRNRVRYIIYDHESDLDFYKNLIPSEVRSGLEFYIVDSTSLPGADEGYIGIVHEFRT